MRDLARTAWNGGAELSRHRCPECGQSSAFGYRNQDGELVWYCTEHRLAQFWAAAMALGRDAVHGRALERRANVQPSAAVSGAGCTAD